MFKYSELLSNVLFPFNPKNVHLIESIFLCVSLQQLEKKERKKESKRSVENFYIECQTHEFVFFAHSVFYVAKKRQLLIIKKITLKKHLLWFVFWWNVCFEYLIWKWSLSGNYVIKVWNVTCFVLKCIIWCFLILYLE